MVANTRGGRSGTDKSNSNEALQAGFFKFSAQDALTATAGGAQAGVSLVNFQVNVFSTVATAGDSAQLPPAEQGEMRIVQNKTATSMNVFPRTGEAIAAGAANAAFAVAANKTCMFVCGTAGNWAAILSA